MCVVILKASTTSRGWGRFWGLWRLTMDRSALGNLLADAWYTFVCEVELLQSESATKPRKQCKPEGKMGLSMIRFKGKQSLMSFVCEHPSFVGTVWGERAWWRNAERLEKQLRPEEMETRVIKYMIVHRIWKAYKIWRTEEVSVFSDDGKYRSVPENTKCERERRRWLQHFWALRLKG